MQKIITAANLRQTILELESKQESEGKILKEQFHLAYESVKPINLIKSTFKEVTASEEIKENLLNAGIGLGVGYVTKVVFQGASHSPLRKLFGTVLEFGIANVVAKNPEVVKAVGKRVFKMVGTMMNAGVKVATQKKVEKKMKFDFSVTGFNNDSVSEK